MNGTMIINTQYPRRERGVKEVREIKKKKMKNMNVIEITNSYAQCILKEENAKESNQVVSYSHAKAEEEREILEMEMAEFKYNRNIGEIFKSK
jgi:hypothetical protein